MKKAKKKAPAKKRAALLGRRELVAVLGALEARVADLAGEVAGLDSRFAVLAEAVTQQRPLHEARLRVQAVEIACLRRDLAAAEVDARRWRASQAIAEK